MVDGAIPWQTWRALRDRDHLLFHVGELPDATGGAVHVRRGEQVVVVIDPRLDRVERTCALAHELVHDERGGGCDHPTMPDTWRPVVAREERTVERITAERLVPTRALLEFCVARADAGLSLSATDVAEEFEVTEQVADQALMALGDPMKGGGECD